MKILSLGVVLMLWFGAVFAEKADRRAPTQIEADMLRLDDVNKTSMFSGSVVLTKGSLVIQAQQLDMRQDASGQQTGVATAKPGEKVTFRQKRDVPDETIEGEAERIEFDARQDQIRLISRAEVRRLRQGKVVDVMSGNLINYNNATEVFSVEGRPAAANAPAERVRAVLAPRSDSAPDAKTSPNANPQRSN